jgi:hypothetical protein
MPAASALDCGSQVCNSIKPPRRPQQLALQSSRAAAVLPRLPHHLALCSLDGETGPIAAGSATSGTSVYILPAAHLARTGVPPALAIHGCSVGTSTRPVRRQQGITFCSTVVKVNTAHISPPDRNLAPKRTSSTSVQ